MRALLDFVRDAAAIGLAHALLAAVFTLAFTYVWGVRGRTAARR